MPVTSTPTSLNALELESITAFNNKAVPIGGVHFNGGSVVNLTTEVALGTADFSVNFQVQYTTIPTSHFAFRSHTSGNFTWSVKVGTAGELTFVVVASGGGTTNISTGYSFELSKNLDIAISFDRDGNASTYVDGVLVNETDISAHSAVNIGSGSSTVGQFGFCSSDAADLVYKSARVFNLALSASQVLEVRRCGVPFDLLGNVTVDLFLGYGKGLHYPDFTNNENHGTGVDVTNLIDNYTKRVDLAYSASLDVDFGDTPEEVLVGQLTGALTLTGSNYHENGETIWRFGADGTNRTVTVPAGWNNIKNTSPLTVQANKAATIVIISSGNTEAECDYFFTIEP